MEASQTSQSKPFQFTRARGARLNPALVKYSSKNRFNSRAHGARDHGPRQDRPAAIVFQFTRARGARLLSVVVHIRADSFQFTRARGARHGQKPRPEPPVDVSIHARTGRATPTRSSPESSSRCFNSRAHGARDHGGAELPHPQVVSIHARTGRATADRPASRPDMMFQFTRARGARRLDTTAIPRTTRFNSRAHGARDRPSARPSRRRSSVSIHARTGRATRWTHTLRPTCSSFQFTRARGARLGEHRSQLFRAPFQFTRARGARRRRRGWTPSNAVRFNSRAHGARDGGRSRRCSAGSSFNSRAHGARDARCGLTTPR